MYTLGINAAFHDSSACLVKDGQVLAAAEEERFTGIKHAKRPVPFSAYELPFHAIAYCLGHAGIKLKNVHHIAYAFQPDKFYHRAPWDPLMGTYIAHAPRYLLDGFPHHLQAAFEEARPVRYQWHFVDHHLAHAASAFLPSPFTEAAVMTLDGRGEQATTTYGIGRGTDIEIIAQVNMPHSLGLLYEAVTDHLGFLHSSDEYKVMALASFGAPVFAEQFRRIIHLTGEGNYEIAAFDFTGSFGPRRKRDEPLVRRHYDIASSLQLVLEETVLSLAKWLRSATRMPDVCLAGGVALNCVLNGRLRKSGIFERVWIQPAAGDAGTAMGAALWADQQLRHARDRRYVMNSVYLGPSFSDEAIEEVLLSAKAPYHRLDDRARDTARLLQQGLIIGWYQGRMEFGPRALGARSLIASPIPAGMKERINNIKDREQFRPVCPSVLAADAETWFDIRGESPFMLFACDVKSDKAASIPAVCHVDGTARIQTVTPDQNPRFFELLKAFKELTGVPILVNTSFNTQGKPIVCTPRDAMECFFGSPLDALVMGPFLLLKDQKMISILKERDHEAERRGTDVPPSETLDPMSVQSYPSGLSQPGF